MSTLDNRRLKIDYDRGVIFKTHPTNGMNVYMYVDTPGKYLNAFGTGVEEKLAAEAGFDIEKYGKLRIKGERMATAMKAIEEELEMVDKVETVVQEQDGFKLIDIGLGRHVLKDPEGNILTTTMLSEEQGKLLLSRLVPQPKEVPDARPKAQDQTQDLTT